MIENVAEYTTANLVSKNYGLGFWGKKFFFCFQSCSTESRVGVNAFAKVSLCLMAG